MDEHFIQTFQAALSMGKKLGDPYLGEVSGVMLSVTFSLVARSNV